MSTRETDVPPPPHVTTASGPGSPYPGLRAFTETEADVFVGREAEVAALWARIPKQRLLAVIGPSGAGKSSFVRAGVVPARPAGWAAIVCTPGAAPLRRLGQALTPALVGDAEALPQLVDFDEPGVAVALLRRWRRAHAEALLVLDQFEELFTLTPPAEQTRVATLIGRVVAEADVRVLLVLRDDFLLRCCAQPALAPVVHQLAPLLSLGAKGLRRALVEPAAACGYRFEPETLPDEMVAVVADTRAPLPLLAFTAARWWDRRNRTAHALTAAGYAAIGGVAGALAQHADETLARIGPGREPLVRELFRNLVTAQGTRAVIGWEELLSVSPDRAAGEAVLRELVDARLLTSYEEPATPGHAPERRVEIVHESLLTMWPRLVRWRTQDEGGAQLRDQLRQAAHLWDEKGRSGDLLWTGTAYREYAVWRERYAAPLTAVDAAYAAAMTEKARRQKRVAVAVVALGFVALAGVAAAIAVSRQQAMHSARQAEASRLVALGRLELERYPTAAVAYARKSLETADTVEARLLAVEALWRGPVARLVRGLNCGLRVAIAPGAEWLACTGFNTEVALVPADGTPPVGFRLEPATGDTRQAVFVDDGRLVLSWLAGDDRVRLIDLEGREVRGFPGDAHLVRVVGDGEFVACGSVPGSRDRVVRVWSWRTGTVRVIDRWTPPPGMRFDQPGVRPLDIDVGLRWLAYADDRTILIHPLGAASGDHVLGSHDSQVRELAFDPRGERLLSIDEAGVSFLWRLPDGRRSRLTSSSPIPRFALPTFLPGGTGVAWMTEGVGVNIWRLDGPGEEPPLVLSQPSADYSGQVAVDPGGHWLASGYASGFSLWPLGQPAPRRLLGHTEGPIERLAFSPDGQFLVSCARDGARLWPIRAGGPPAQRLEVGGDYMCYEAAVSPDSLHVAIASPFKGVYLVPVAGGTPRRLIDYSISRASQGGLAFDRSGMRLAVGQQYAASGNPITLAVVTLATGDVSVFAVGDGPTANPYEDGIFDLAFVADDLIAVAGRGGVRTWDMGGRSALLVSTGFAAAALSGDRRRLAVLSGESTGSEDFLFDNGVALVVDLAAGRRREVPWQRGAFTHALALDSAGERLVASDLSGNVRVGRVAGGPPHLLIGHANRVTDVAISPDDRWIASAAGAEIRLWPMPDLAKPPLHTLSHDLLLTKLRALTNLEVVADSTTESGYRLQAGPFPGWKNVPEW